MAKKKDNKIQLRKEIAGLLDQIDEEGLLFLKKQATTIIYNETVLEMNRKNQESLLENYQESCDEKPKKKEKTKSAPPEKKIYVDMEGESKGYCNVVCGKVRVFFPLDEMGTMVYIAEKAAKSGDAGLLLYRWLKKERGDFLVDNGIKSYPSPTIDALAAYLSET